jgi:hypothetical protein
MRAALVIRWIVGANIRQGRRAEINVRAMPISSRRGATSSSVIPSREIGRAAIPRSVETVV